MPCGEILRWTQPCKSIWQLHPPSKANPNHPRQAAFQPTGEILVVLASEVPSSALYLGYMLKDYIAHNYLCLLQDRKTSCPLGGFACLLDMVGNWGISRALGDEGIKADARGSSHDVSRTEWQGQGPGSDHCGIPAWPLTSSVTLASQVSSLSLHFLIWKDNTNTCLYHVRIKCSQMCGFFFFLMFGCTPKACGTLVFQWGIALHSLHWKAES